MLYCMCLLECERIEFIVLRLFSEKIYLNARDVNRGPSERTSTNTQPNNRERREDPCTCNTYLNKLIFPKTWPNVQYHSNLEYYLNTLYLFRFHNVCIFLSLEDRFVRSKDIK